MDRRTRAFPRSAPRRAASPAGLLAALLASTITLAATACDAPTGDPPRQALDGILDPAFGDLPGRPFAVRVMESGSILVTRQDANRVSILAPADIGPRDSASVGADPGDVVIGASATSAIVSTFYGGSLHFVNAVTGDETDLTSIGSNAYRLAVSASRGHVFVTTTNGRVYAVSLATGDKVDSVNLSGSLQGIAVRRDGRLAVSSSAGRITILDPATLDVLVDRTVPGVVQDIVFSADGKSLFAARENPGDVLVLAAGSLATVDSIRFTGPLPVTPFGLSLSPNGATLVVGSALDGTVALVNATSHEVRTVLDVGGVPRRIAFHPDGSRAYVANEAGRVDVIR